MCDVKIQKMSTATGFTLVELMIAMVLFSVALLGIASLATVVINGNNISKHITTATTLAQQKMEEFIRKGYKNYTTTTPGNTLYNEPYGTISSVVNNPVFYARYRRNIIVENGPIANTRKLTVKVYRRKSGVFNINSSANSLSTIIAK